MIKKWFSLAVCVLMMAGMLSFGTTVSAAPADLTVFTVSATEGGVGDTVTVSISLSENSFFTNATFYLHYDASKVAFVADSLDVGKASPSGKSMFDALDHPDSQFVKGAYVTISGIKKAGELIKMDFEVLDASPAAFSLSFDECVGVDENDVEFDVKYQIVGCVLNNDGTVEVPTGGPVVTTTVVTTTTSVTTPQGDATTVPDATTVSTESSDTATTGTSEQEIDTPTDSQQAVAPTTTTHSVAATTTTGVVYDPTLSPDASASTTTAKTDKNDPVTNHGTTAGTMPTMVVTDEGNNKITIPVVTTTDDKGNVATVPVAVVTDVNGTTVTVPVVIVTDTQGSVATIPVADGTDAQGNDVTIPVAIVTDAQGNVETVPVATATDAKGSIVTIPVTTLSTPTTAPVAENSGLTTSIIIVVIGVVVAAVVAFAAMKLRKKNEE